MKISNFIQSKGLENSFSFISLVPQNTYRRGSQHFCYSMVMASKRHTHTRAHEKKKKKSNTVTFFFLFFFPDCEFFNSVNIKPDNKLKDLFDKINPKPKF